MFRVMQIEKELQQFLANIPVGVTPGLHLQVHQKGQRILDVRHGDTYSFYDLASLTKPIFTAMAIAWAVDQDKLLLETPVKYYLDTFSNPLVKVGQLLTHTSGLASYIAFYEKLSPQADLANWSLMESEILAQPLGDNTKAVYSDLGYLLLKSILEKAFDKSLHDIWEDIHQVFYSQVLGLHFCNQNTPKFQLHQYAPTARCPWREQLIQGQVHDENAWLLNGVATHAGLFGSVDDVSWAALMMRAQMLGLGKKILKNKTAQLFFSRAIPQSVGDWALGLMLPSATQSSAGQYFAPSSIGHLGFTGTSFWFDPKSDLLVTILSNRVFYGRNNKEFNQWRPLLHDRIVELMKRY